jgi:hypothetical protein
VSGETLHVPGNLRGRGRKPVKAAPTPPTSVQSVQAERERLFSLAAATEEEKPLALPQIQERRQECPQCRGKQYVWLMNLLTLQREIGDCPSCGGKRPEVSEKARKHPPKPARTGFHYVTRP